MFIAPFISRRRYDTLRACHLGVTDQLDHAIATNERLTAELTAVNARYDRLVQQVVSLKRKGFELDREPKLKIRPQPDGPEERIAKADQAAMQYEQETITAMMRDIRSERPELSESQAMAHARDLLATVDTYTP